MYEDDCQEDDNQNDSQCIEATPKKAVELSIVILVDKEEKCPPPPAPPVQQCCPPCQPCFMCCLPPPCQVQPCTAGASPYASLPAPPATAPSTTSVGSGPCSSSAGRKPKGGRGEGLRRIQSTTGCQTISESQCQTDPCAPPAPAIPCRPQCCTQGVQYTAMGQTTAGSQTVPGKICRQKKTCQTYQTPEKMKECRPTSKQRPPSSGGEAPAVIPREVCVTEAKKKHHHRHHKHKKTPKQRRHSIPAPQINFTECPSPHSFIHYFLKFEMGGPLVINLSETKLQYEKLCRQKLSGLQKHLRYRAQDFFLRVVDAINTATPDTQHTEIRHYHIMKYLHPIVAALQIDAVHENNSIHKYQRYIYSVVKQIEERMKMHKMVDPTCLVEIETQLFAGMVSRFYPIFIKVKDVMLAVIKQGELHEKFTPDEFIKQSRKLILCVYVELSCIENTFTNFLTSMTYLPSVEIQEDFRQQLLLRKKHARHATKWAIRCFATALLYYYIQHMDKI